MSVKKDASGHRYVESQVEVPGTPEEVWQAIATGPGVSSWFVPAKVDQREGGMAILDFGPGMESKSVVTAWEPPRRFAAESSGDMGPNGPAVATEWTVEAKSGGTCIVRVVHRWFATTDDWDNQFEGMEHGWPSFFRILHLYMTHFRGVPGVSIQLMGAQAEPIDKAWEALTRSLGLVNAAVGQRVSTSAGAPPLAGLVEHTGPAEHPELLLRLERPAPGVGHLLAIPMGDQVMLSVRFYIHGDGAPRVVASEEPIWRAWMNEHFPMRAGASC